MRNNWEATIFLGMDRRRGRTKKQLVNARTEKGTWGWGWGSQGYGKLDLTSKLMSSPAKAV